MGSFSLIHWIIVLVVILLLFGPRRLPDLAKGVGEAIREFKKAINSPESPAQKQVGQKDDDINKKDPPSSST
jgi:sec-independent protein translocase protein TatA